MLLIIAPASLSRFGCAFLSVQIKLSNSALVKYRLVDFFCCRLFQISSRPVYSMRVVGSSYRESVFSWHLTAFSGVKLGSNTLDSCSRNWPASRFLSHPKSACVMVSGCSVVQRGQLGDVAGSIWLILSLQGSRRWRSLLNKT